jgi:hypothetical protein
MYRYPIRKLVLEALDENLMIYHCMGFVLLIAARTPGSSGAISENYLEKWPGVLANFGVLAD